MQGTSFDNRQFGRSPVHREVSMDSLFGALKSKTIWASVGVAVLGVLVPPVNVWIAANPGTAATAVSVLMAVLRTMTTTSLSNK